VQLSLNLGSSSSSSRQPQGGAAYIVFHDKDDAWSCIQDIDNCVVAGKLVKACFGTTKYCHAYLKGLPCSNLDCQYCHELGANSTLRPLSSCCACISLELIGSEMFATSFLVFGSLIMQVDVVFHARVGCMAVAIVPEP
jgi:hypothetical protein